VTTSDATTRPSAANLPKYASIALFFQDGTNDGSTIDFWEISAEPIGQPYGSAALGGSKANWGTVVYDDDGDVAPDEPRETASSVAQLNSIDIAVTDSTLGSPAEHRLLTATPRKWYTQASDSSPNVSGTSYLYPGVSDLEYLQNETNISLALIFDLGGVGDSRHLIFPSTTHNAIKEVSMISFRKDENPTGTIDQGWFNPADTSGSQRTASGAQIIDRLGGLWFDEKYEPGGWTGDEVYTSSDGKYHGPKVNGSTRPTISSNDETYVNSVGSHIANVKSIYVGTNWNYNSTNAKAPPFWDAYISSDASNANLNGYGTTLGNTTDFGTGYKAENPNLAKYNRMGGIYVKQSKGYYGVTYIDNDSEIRASVGINGTNLVWTYAANESTAPAEEGYLVLNGASVDAIDFTGQHRSCSPDDLGREHVGLIVISLGMYKNLSSENVKPSINEALPCVQLSSKRNQKSVYGVISDKEESDQPRTYLVGKWVSSYQRDEQDEDRLIINALGEGAIWVCNINGNLENGDYITSCEIPGHGMRQDDDLLHNYTVAKITQDCTFELDNPRYDCVEFEFEGQTYRKAFVGCTYHCG
jgi:hypothetical protein